MSHRPYDAALRAELASAAAEAAGIPPVMSALTVGLATTCSLAAAVATNATDDEHAELIAQDLQRRPLSVAVQLLAETARRARNRGSVSLEVQADPELAALWNSTEWSDPDVWNPDDANGRSIHEHGSRVTSPEHVKLRLAEAIARRPEILLPLVTACAGWEEQLDSEDWSLVGLRRRYRALPAWFPSSFAVAAIQSAAPGAASIAVDTFGDTSGDDPESLMAQILWLANRPAT